MELTYTSPFEAKPGMMARLPNQSCARLAGAEPEIWEPEKLNREKSGKKRA